MKHAEYYIQTISPIFYQDSPDTKGTAYTRDDVVELIEKVIELEYLRGYDDATRLVVNALNQNK